MESLHDKIMSISIPKNYKQCLADNPILSYKYGHRDARHAAAEMVIEYEEVNRNLLKALCQLLVEVNKQDDTRPSERKAIAESENVLPQHVTKEFIEAIAKAKG